MLAGLAGSEAPLSTIGALIESILQERKHDESLTTAAHSLMAAATSLLAGDGAPDKPQEAQPDNVAPATADQAPAAQPQPIDQPQPPQGQQEVVTELAIPRAAPSPPAGQPPGVQSAAPLTLDEVRGMSAESINQNWAAVGAALKAER